MCACVCVFFPFILDIKFVGRTSRGHTEEGHTGFLIHLLSAVLALLLKFYSLEHNQCYNIVIGKEKYIYILQVHRQGHSTTCMYQIVVS